MQMYVGFVGHLNIWHTEELARWPEIRDESYFSFAEAPWETNDAIDISLKFSGKAMESKVGFQSSGDNF